MLFPESGGQFGDARCGMLADPLQDIDQIVVGIDVVKAAGGQQALHNTHLFGPQFRPAK